MKKTKLFLVVIALLSCLFIIVSCGSDSPTTDETTATLNTEDTTEPSMTDDVSNPITMDDILSEFSDPSYFQQEYNHEMIDSIKENIGKHNIALDGNILRVNHTVDQGKSNDVLIFIYVYEFELVSDAILFENNRKDFMSTMENGCCVRFGTVVVFGNSDVIPTLGK